VQRALTEWALARRARAGAPIKLRIVKGANLAMERIEAAVHGWPQAPTRSRRGGCQLQAHARVWLPARAGRRRSPGVASHNLFDVAYGLVLREAHHLEPWVEFEMLEGMANHQARAVHARAGGLLLYAPVVRAEDFHSAIAYLVRRLDENTAPENFLRTSSTSSRARRRWLAERERFLGPRSRSGTVLRRAPAHP
jgi:RHH-type proline utilization regulon transcriptional repressor/proline dehydrogenase/delta 1-pyrroline-5-carboxylate dehydrogenase